MDYESLLGLFKQRRSIRAFKTDPVDDASIQKIVECVHWAPSGMNTQPWEVVVVKDPELKEGVAKIIEEVLEERMKNMPPRPYAPMDFSKAPVFILLFADSRIRNFMPPMDDNRWDNLSNSNMALGFYNMLLAVSTLGLGAQWMSVAGEPAVAEHVKALLNLPDFLVSYAMVALGHPDGEPLPKAMRPTREMVHFDACQPTDFRSEEDIKAFLKG